MAKQWRTMPSIGWTIQAASITVIGSDAVRRSSPIYRRASKGGLMFGIILAHSVCLSLDSWPTCAVMSWIPGPGG
jgi:hypothetical protein